MKHIDFSNIGLGMELSPSFNKQNQEGVLERLSSMLKGLTNNAAGIIILEGCVMTKIGNQYDQTAGVIFYNGEILTVDVFAGNDAVLIPVFNAVANTYTQQAWYGDGVKRDTFYARKMPMAMQAAGSGLADYTAVTRMEDIKANKVQGAWTLLTLINGWIHGTGSDGEAYYRIDDFGRVNLKGSVDGSAASSYDFTHSLPNHPTLNKYVVIRKLNLTNEAGFLDVISVSNTTQMIIRNGIGNYFSLEGASYWLD